MNRAEDNEDRRRIRYTATIDALAHLGVSSAHELPQYAEFTASLSDAEVHETAAAPADISDEN